MKAEQAPTILVADDDAGVRALVARLLALDFPGASVVLISDPGSVAKTAAALRPQLVILDWVFGRGLTGPALCRQLKSQPTTKAIPVILMTGQRTTLANRAETLRSGADLFLAKPFTREELSRYCLALLERAQSRPEREIFRLGSLTLRREDQAVWRRGQEAFRLPPRLFELLWHLAHRSPEPLAISELVRLVWKNAVRDKHAHLAVSRLRAKLPLHCGLAVERAGRGSYRLVFR